MVIARAGFGLLGLFDPIGQVWKGSIQRLQVGVRGEVLACKLLFLSDRSNDAPFPGIN